MIPIVPMWSLHKTFVFLCALGFFFGSAIAWHDIRPPHFSVTALICNALTH